MAGAGQSGNQAANTGLATTASGAQTMGTGQGWQGLGNQGIASWGNILNTGFNNQMDAWKAKQEQSSGWGSALGLAASFLPGFADGGAIPEEASPSNGAIVDDVPAIIDGQGQARLNAGEFVLPEDVTRWIGEKGIQQMILKSRKEMTGQNGERPAQPTMGPPPDQGAIPMPAGG